MSHREHNVIQEKIYPNRSQMIIKENNSRA